jgi:hypothetical protein
MTMGPQDMGRAVPVHASGPGGPTVGWVGPRPMTRPRSNRGALLALPSFMAIARGELDCAERRARCA